MSFWNLNSLFHANMTVKDIILPIGISFYEAAIIGTLAVIFTERALRRTSKRIAALAKDKIKESEAQNGPSD